MAYDDYMKANKEGKKQYRSCVANGEFPYLPVLDEMISLSDIECEMNLGVQFIPLSHVVGTASFGRTTAFSNQFMPLLDYATEFGNKWSTLCDAQLNEGIHYAIKTYEYMNRYYVIEGNKRVSVLKYFNAVNIAAEVIRKVPKRTDDLQNKIYYEFMAFQKLSNINYVEFSKEGSFSKLQQCVKGSLEEPWTDEDKENFSSFHLAFEKNFSTLGGKKLPITTDDALLSFVIIYGYKECLEMSAAQLKEAVEKYWKEFTLIGEPDSQEVLTDPDNKKDPVNVGKNMLRFILPSTQKKLKAAFIYDKSPEDSGWIYGHELGRQYLEENFGDLIETTSVVCFTGSEESDSVLEDIISDGYQVIFTTTPDMSKPSLKTAIDHPEVKILNCSLNISHSHVRSYNTRLYELKFLTGIIAGALTENDKVGYLADYPIFGTIANINAFALGAKMVNPRAKIYLTWTALKDNNPEEFFRQNDIKYISDKDMADLKKDNRQFGLYQLENGTRTNLATSICNWGVFYKQILQSIFSGTWKNVETADNAKAINYWWGLSAGVIELICSNKIPESTMHLVNTFQNMIRSGYFHPFSGRLYSQNDTIQSDEHGYLTPEQIINMDWLSDNVIGSIPTMDQIKNNAKTVVKAQGVTGVTATDEKILN